MKLNKKIILGTVALAGILAIPSAFRNTATYPTGCETYQGYRMGFDGEVFLYFDEKTLEKRGNRNPNHILLGNPEWANELKIGQKYRLQIEELTKSFSPLQPNIERLVSFQQCTDSEERIQSSE